MTNQMMANLRRQRAPIQVDFAATNATAPSYACGGGAGCGAGRFFKFLFIIIIYWFIDIFIFHDKCPWIVYECLTYYCVRVEGCVVSDVLYVMSS
jgi:hypothetical protein